MNAGPDKRPARALAASVYSPPRARVPWRLEDQLPGARVRYFAFGRQALAEGLRLLGARPGDSVLLPELVCRELLSSLAAVGARPAFYPVGADLSPALPPERWPRAKAVLAVNYFGFPQELGPFQSYCRSSGATLIEDNAHGLFSRDAQGRPLGTRSDLGVFSLRKSLPLPNGAALAAPAAGPLRLASQVGFAGFPGPGATLKAAARAAARVLGPRTCAALRAWKRGLAGGAGAPGSAAERELPAGDPCRQLAAPIRAADPSEEILRRRRLYALAAGLGGGGLVPVFPRLPEAVVPYGYPFRPLPGLDPEALLAPLGLFSLPWPELPSALARKAPVHYRDIRVVHFLW